MPERKKVVWDEGNLTQNEEYRRLHPVTMKIDEPKTPYCFNSALEEDENTFERELAAERETTWDITANELARRAKHVLPAVIAEVVATETVPEVSIQGSSKRPRPAIAVVSEEHIKEVEQSRQETEFRSLRKVVYADEGAKFKLMLNKKDEDEDLDEELPSSWNEVCLRGDP